MSTTPRMVVFLGPSMSHDDARRLAPDAIILPPVCQGDLLSACEMHSPEVVVMIDGEFGQSLSVWHKEVLFVLDQGVRVFGASSMGALRASELDRFGMEGIGEVYRHYADGFLTADEDVALLHADADYGWRPFTWPMVNVWATIAHLRATGLADDDGCDALQSAADALHFTQRSRNALAQTLVEQGRDDAEQLVDLFVANFVDQKRLDAIEAITTALRSHEVPRPDHEEPLHLFGRIGESMQSTDTLVPSSPHPMRRYQLVNDVALHDPQFERLSQRALDRAVVLEYANEAGVDPTVDEIEQERVRFFGTIGVADDDIPAWIEANDFMPGEFDRFLRDEARRRHMQRWVLDVRLYERNRKLIIDQLRYENRYTDAVKAASRRRQLADSRPPVEWPTETEVTIDLILRHQIAAKWPLYFDLETTASDHGFESTSGLLTAILDATAARQEASARRERMAKMFADPAASGSAPATAAVTTVAAPTTDEAERAAARAVHGMLESHQLTSVGLAFVDLGVADAIAGGATTVEAIATACDAPTDRIGRFLAAARNVGLVAGGGDSWALTPSGEVLRSDHQASLVPYARDLRARSLPAWARLADVVRGGDAPDNSPSVDADLAFSGATWALGADALMAGLFPADFSGHIVDVGGGLGRAAMFIASHCTSAKVSLVDVPDVAARARDNTAGTRVEVHTADTFEGGADRVTMSRVLCTLPDDAAQALLTQVRAWSNDDCEVHLLDCVPSDLLGTSTIDMFNLVRGGGGARTEQQWRDLASASGFTLSAIRPFLGPFSDIVLIPARTDGAQQ